MSARRLRGFLGGCAIAAAALLAPPGASAADKTLRLQMLADVEVLDPARAGSLSALNTVAPLYHQLLTYDYLARPVRLIPYAAEALPQVSADGRTYTLRVRPGLLFAPHPAFGGKPRELNAQDFVYSVQRIADPASLSMSFAQFEGLIEGLDDLIAAARREKRGLDYAAPIAGLRALDARTLEIRLTRPDPTFIYGLAYAGWSAVPREVVEAEGAEFSRKPIGSGPYLVERFQPGTRLSLVRNPAFKRLPWTAFAPNAKPDDPVLKAMRGVMVPAADRVEMTRIAEPSTALKAFFFCHARMMVNNTSASTVQSKTLAAPLLTTHAARATSMIMKENVVAVPYTDRYVPNIGCASGSSLRPTSYRKEANRFEKRYASKRRSKINPGEWMADGMA